MIEDVANAFVTELKKSLSDDIHFSRGYRGWLEVGIFETVNAFVKPAIGDKIEIEIPRTGVSKLRAYQVQEINDSEFNKAVKAFIEIHNKIAAQQANRKARNEEIAHLQPLPSSIYVSRKAEGKFSVSFQKDMSLRSLERFVEYINNFDANQEN